MKVFFSMICKALSVQSCVIQSSVNSSMNASQTGSISPIKAVEVNLLSFFIYRIIKECKFRRKRQNRFIFISLSFLVIFYLTHLFQALEKKVCLSQTSAEMNETVFDFVPNHLVKICMSSDNSSRVSWRVICADRVGYSCLETVSIYSVTDRHLTVE